MSVGQIRWKSSVWRAFGLLPAVAAALLVPGPGASASAQVVPMNRQVIPLRIGEAEVLGRNVAPTPFGPGETMKYNVKLGILSVGSGYMAVTTVDTLRGREAYHAVMHVEGGIPLARVKDTFQTWMDIDDLSSLRFVQDQDEVGQKRNMYYELYPDSGTWYNTRNDTSGELASNNPLDDISFVYYLRALDLQVGDAFSFPKYFKDDGNPVQIFVERIDTVEVPAGVFETIVVRPEIQTKGLFGQGGEAEIHLTNDERRIVVYLRSKVPVMGSLTLHLTEINEGIPLNRGLAPPPDDLRVERPAEPPPEG
jgi:hypothetical protein